MFEKNSERTILFLYNCIFTRFFNVTVVITVPKSDETPMYNMLQDTYG